jgi:tether containing UBX domain for GLUT4
VALQLPEPEAQGVPNGRLLDKFPSTTTVWLVLRKFEAGVAGNGSSRNLTARGTPAVDTVDTGAGRLYYQTPVVQAVGRELSSFTDLQKTLAQLGFNSGNVLFRLSFRTTQEPLEEAMAKISESFKAFEEPDAPSSATDVKTNEPAVPPAQPADESLQPATSQPPAPERTELSAPTAESSQPPPSDPLVIQSVSSRPVTVYKPPSRTTPHSALTSYRDADYIPSIEHAKSHQDRLNQASRNTRLPSDKEIAAKAAAEQEKLAAIKEVEVKIRFPEQSQVVSKFAQADTGAALYGFVRSCLNGTFANEKFSLALFGTGPLRGPGHNQNIPDSEQTLLIKDLGLRGRVLVNFTWDDQASLAARGSGTNLLKAELRSQAQDIQILEVSAVAEEEEPGKSTLGRLGAAVTGQDGNSRSSGRKGGVPKWLKLPGKK